LLAAALPAEPGRAFGRGRRFSHHPGANMNNDPLFPPFLYQVATGFLDVSSIAYPFRKLFHGNQNIRFRLGNLQKVTPEDNKVFLSARDLSYDYLVLATGT
jgi:NADH dehydrogenase